MSRRKPLAVLAAVMAALTLAVPATSATAATTTHSAYISPIVVGGRLVPGSFPCQILIRQVQLAYATGNLAWASIVSNIFIYSGCGGAAI
jgi:hypothetical protein